MKCLNVIVFYDNREEVSKYISEVSDISNGMVDMVVVNNRNSRREDLDALCAGRAKVVDYGENVGYLNSMLKYIRGEGTDRYDYVILSNTDIHYDMKSFFSRLAEKQYAPDIGCIAPSVFSTKIQNYQNPHYIERIPKEKFERLVRIFGHPWLGRLYLKLSEWKATAATAEKKDSRYVYSPNGSYMIFTRDFIAKIRGYEYGVTLYSEESCVGELLRKHNMKCFYDNSIEVIHQESTVTGKMNYKARFEAWRTSMEYILREFYSENS